MRKRFLATFVFTLIVSSYISADNQSYLEFEFPLSDTEVIVEKSPFFTHKSSFVNFSKNAAVINGMTSSKALGLEAQLNKYVLDQTDATKVTADAMLRHAAGIADPKAPIAVLLYLGPTGVGKTELAKALAIEVFGSERKLIRFNMEEFTNEAGVQRLIGVPNGYRGSEEGGQLTNAIASNPYSVVLFDEIEKANPEVQKLLLQLFDEGLITSALGEVVNARGVIFILTSNCAATKVLQLKQAGHTSEEVLQMIEPHLMQAMSPELYNRVQPVVFNGLSPQTLAKIVEKMAGELRNRVHSSKGIHLYFDQSLLDYLATAGYHPTLGARPLKRLIERDLTTVVARAILQGKYTYNSSMKVYYVDGKVIVK